MDRNYTGGKWYISKYSSPPARVAWIETYVYLNDRMKSWVATREGGVDRNEIAVEIDRKSVV